MPAVSVNLDVHDVAGALKRLRAERPAVRCLVGPDVGPLARDALAAVGASVTPFTGTGGAPRSRPGAAFVVLGSLDDEAAGAAAVAVADAGGTDGRWVLDPDTASGAEWLARAAQDLLVLQPRVIRGTAAEVVSLACSGGRVDGVESVEGSFHLCNDLARRVGAVVSVSGEVDLVTDGERAVRVQGGSALLARVPGIGTALTALVAAYLAVVDDAMLAALAAHVHVGLAGEVADQAGAVGGADELSARWVAALAEVDEAAVVKRARLV